MSAMESSAWVGRGIGLALVLLAVFLFVMYMTRMPGRSYRGELAPLSETEQTLRDEMRSHVTMLAGNIGERNMTRPAELARAAGYIRETFLAQGYDVRDQAYRVENQEVRNLEVEIRGTTRPEEIVVIGAHYDSVAGSPGANDNASGVAALLVLAKRAREVRPARTLRFVAFVNEEPPYFLGRAMGSQVYALEARKHGEKIVAMISLETIGCYFDVPGSQAYPFPLSLLYPGTGNFIGFVGNLTSRDEVREAIRVFRETTKFPSEGVAALAFIPGVGWSDHKSFWDEGYPGVMVTDTALYRYPQYHTARDTPEILDYDRLARVVGGLERVVTALAGSATGP